MKITACPKCGSNDIYQQQIEDRVLYNHTTICACETCGYKGSGITLEQFEGTFQEVKPMSAGFIGLWEICVKLDNAENKKLEVLWKDARDCIHSLHLEKGDRIRVILDEKLWSIEKLPTS